MNSMSGKSLAALFALALTLVLATAPLAAQQPVDIDLEALAAYIEQARIAWKVPSLVADLTHWHHNTFEIHWRTPSPWYSRGWVQFVLDHQGNVTELLLDVPNDDFWFDEPEFKKRD